MIHTMYSHAFNIEEKKQKLKRLNDKFP